MSRLAQPANSNLQPFIEYLQFERRYSPLTVENYQRDILQFTQWLFGQDLQTSLNRRIRAMPSSN